MLSDTDVEDHYNPSTRLITVERNGLSCGFQLTRGKWDPYPWVKSVSNDSAADLAGLKAGDCLLEVNGEDILGRRISEVAEIVKSKLQVSLLLWNAGVDSQCSPEAICCGPMPTNLQKLSACLSPILTFLECPVCLDTIPPPTYQCENGHLICLRCRSKSERCPVCRIRYDKSRSLLADQVYNSLIDSFDLRKDSADSRKAKIQQIFKTKYKNVPEIRVTQSHTNKFLARIIGKATSVDNLAQGNLENHFVLRKKSLSSQEIFQNDGQVSRSSSISRLARHVKSCHGSFESLTESVGYHCPFKPTCDELIKGHSLVEHFQIAHDGPLIHFYKPFVKITLQEIMERSSLYLLHFEKHLFLINIELGMEKTDNVILWTWLCDDGKAAKEYDMQVKVSIGEEDIVLSVRNNVLPLTSMSSIDIRTFKKGILFNINSIVKELQSNIIFEVEILKSDYI